MPLFDFKCKQCEHVEENEYVPPTKVDETKELPCPACKDGTMIRLIGSPSWIYFSEPGNPRCHTFIR